MSDVTFGRQFGTRRGYCPAPEREYDTLRAQQDALYLAENADEINIVMRYVALARDQLSVTIAAIREQGTERRLFEARTLGDICVELYRARETLQGNVGYYAVLVLAIDERVENAQRYVVEHSKA